MQASLARTFESLHVRNYRMFFWGQVVSWTGTWVQWVAQGWLVLELTGDSGLGLGLITAFQWLPVLLLGAWGGVIADRFDKRHLLIGTNVAMGVLSLVLGLATVGGFVSLPIVMVIALLLEIANAMDYPARQTFTMEMVGRDRLVNAVSLNTATFTTARVVGPAAAGFLISGVGVGPCFLVNAASVVPLTLALLAMRTDELRPSEPTARSKGQIRDGLRYVGSKPILKTVLVMMAVIGTLQYNFQVLLPILAKETFAGDARTLGLLGAAVGIGMFSGSMLNAAFGDGGRRLLLGAGFALGGLSIVVAAAPNVWIAALLFVPLGAASMAFLATMNSTLQLNASDAMRGRVMALYLVLFLGSTPIGAPIVGAIAEVIDPRAAFALGGLATLVGCLYGYLKLPPLRTHEPEPEPEPVPVLQAQT